MLGNYLEELAQAMAQESELAQQVLARPLAEQVRDQARQVQALLVQLVQAQEQVVLQARALVVQAQGQGQALAEAQALLAKQERVLARLLLAQVSVRQLAQG